VNRVSSNTPLQALVLLNDPIFLEASRVFAANILRSGAGWDAQLNFAFSRALNRLPSPDDRKVLTDLHEKSLKSFGSGESNAEQFLSVGEAPLPETDHVKLAAMTTVARAILNLHEAITRN
jgi:hypothetical protein